MDSTCKTRSLQSLSKDLEKQNITLKHKLQRPEGQWNLKKKSILIDSLLRKYPVNPSYGVVQDDGKLAIIDGVQRLSTIRDYLNDEFALCKDMKSITINDAEVNLSGLKFSKLSEDVQSELLSSELQIYRLSDCTEEDIREIFERQNAGKPLTSKLMRVIYGSEEFNAMVFSLIDHPFMNKVITPAQHRNGTDRDVIIQTIMLMASNQEHEFTSFRRDDADLFVKNYGDQYLDKADLLVSVLDKFDEAFESKIKIHSTSLPQIFYAGYRVQKDNKDFSALIEKVKEFINTYDDNEEYKETVKGGTSSQENVRKRFDYWRNIVNQL